MKAPFLVHLALYTQAIPVLAFAAARRRTLAGTCLVLGCVVGLIGDNVAKLVLIDLFRNNHVESYISMPTIMACFLVGLRQWQLTPRERRGVQVMMFAALVACVLLVAFVEDVRNFTSGVGPLTSLAVLAVALWTMLRRASALEDTPMLATEWFWAVSGVALLSATTALTSPIGGLLLAMDRLDLFDLTWQVRGLLVSVSYALIGWGVWRGVDDRPSPAPAALPAVPS